MECIKSAGLYGMTAYTVEAECDLAPGIPRFDVVGLPDAAVKESRDRVRAAIAVSGLSFPFGKVTVNLAPADVKKEGTAFELAIAVALGVMPLYFSIPVVILAAFFLLRMASHPHWNSDAAIAAVSASTLAIGILVISRTTGMTTDVDNYMFGSVLAMTKGDVALSVILSVTVLALYLLFYHQIFAVTFDESFSRATGLKVDACNTLLAILTALTIVLGMRMMGAMLISSLVIFPALTAMRLFKSFRGVILCAAVTSVVCFCVGLTISFGFSAPVGATVVAADLTVFLAACLLAALRRK